ncbi:hypothetical protein METP2_03682 [Methanosarcinales archaeon]|nr:hypothetical protein [Candidatus Methanoperedens sp.]CAG1005687.1 hypothetical protein METP2_03682 [Methanosarcinales archaeon]
MEINPVHPVNPVQNKYSDKLLLEEDQQQMYLSTLNKVIKKGSYVIIAAFSLKGAKKCSCLDVKNYDQDMLAKFLGEDFSLLEYFDYTYYMLSGEPRPMYMLYFRTGVNS